MKLVLHLSNIMSGVNQILHKECLLLTEKAVLIQWTRLVYHFKQHNNQMGKKPRTLFQVLHLPKSTVSINNIGF